MLVYKGECTQYAQMLITIQMTFSQPAYYSGHFLAFKLQGRKQKNGCSQDITDQSGQRKSNWKHRLPFHVNSPQLCSFPFIIKQPYSTEQSNGSESKHCLKDLIAISSSGAQHWECSAGFCCYDFSDKAVTPKIDVAVKSSEESRLFLF